MTNQAEVEMIICGEDPGPDGDGMKIVFHGEFLSREEALQYRNLHHKGMLGYIYTRRTGSIEWLDEEYSTESDE